MAYAAETRRNHHRCCKRQCTLLPTVLHYIDPEFRFWSLWPPFQNPPGATDPCRSFWRYMCSGG